MKNNSHSISIACLGDIAPIEPAAGILMADIRSHRNHFETLFAGSDIVFGNLEAPLTNTTAAMEDKKYLLKADPRVLNAFPPKFIFSLANNHILDYGHDGLFETIEHLSKNGFRFTGAGKNLAAAGKPVTIDCKGKTIGFLAAADSRYQTATETEPGVFPADPALLGPRINRLGQKTDIVYVSIHMGMEYIPVPAPNMFHLAESCHQAGAHVVFFHHAHCISGYTASPNRTTLWGTGNFLFPDILDHPFTPWFETATWHIRHQTTGNGIRVSVEPFKLDNNGMPQRAGPETDSKITKKIAVLGGAIERGKHLGLLRLANICKPAYLRLLIANYADIARRSGAKQMAGQILSSIETLFLNKKL